MGTFGTHINPADVADIENSVTGFFNGKIVSIRTGIDLRGRKVMEVYYGKNSTRTFTWLGDKLANGHARLGVF